jgi:hypothetical protein
MLMALAAPFPREAISWRAQKLTANKDKALALAYIDARDVMRRLDTVCGPENWSDSYAETPRGRVICTLSIRINGEWISKSDGAGDTDVEGEKGGLSDAFKRAAVKWGIGRYLYEVEAIYAPCETFKDRWCKWKQEAFAMFAKALARAEAATFTVAREPEPEAQEINPPESVTMFISALEQAMRNGKAGQYWKDNHKALPDGWLAYATAQKDKIKSRFEAETLTSG